MSGVFILVLLVCGALGTVLSVWVNSERYVKEELRRTGFGTLTAWVSGVPDRESLAASIVDLDEVDHVDTQSVIYSDYTVRVSPPHISSAEGITVSQLNRIINENTNLPEYTEFLHSESAIAGFMLILQNAFSGLLAAFVAVLFFVVLIVLGHSIGSTIEADYVNMGILKTVGFTGSMLRRIQMVQYLIVILGGMV